VDLKLVFLDDRAWPRASHKLVFSNELTGRLHQDRKDLERSAPQRNEDPTRAQFTPRKVNLPPAKLVHQVSTLFRHAREAFRNLGLPRPDASHLFDYLAFWLSRSTSSSIRACPAPEIVAG
jgi:hypothetical protein